MKIPWIQLGNALVRPFRPMFVHVCAVLLHAHTCVRDSLISPFRRSFCGSADLCSSAFCQFLHSWVWTDRGWCIKQQVDESILHKYIYIYICQYRHRSCHTRTRRSSCIASCWRTRSRHPEFDQKHVFWPLIKS